MEERRVRCDHVCEDRRTTFVQHVSEGSTTKYDASLDDERKPVPARYTNPVILACIIRRCGRHDSDRERVSDISK